MFSNFFFRVFYERNPVFDYSLLGFADLIKYCEILIINKKCIYTLEFQIFTHK